LPVRARTSALLAALLVALPLLGPAAMAQEQRSTLSQTQHQLDQVEAVLGNARADSVAVSAALAEADQAVAGARGRLALARARLDAAHQRSARAASFAARTAAELDQLHEQVAERARAAYITGGSGDLTVLVDPDHLPELLDQAATLDYIAQTGTEAANRMRVVQHQAGVLHARALGVERERRAAGDAVAKEVADLEHVQAVRVQAKRALDARIAGLAGQAATLRARSAELRRLIQQEEAARARAAAERRAREAAARQSAAPVPAAPVRPASGGRCDLLGASSAERWIIMHESGGNPTADNPTSTAFGLGQLLLGNRILYLGADYATTDCGKQLAAFRAYVRDRYGTAAAAMAFWLAHQWY